MTNTHSGALPEDVHKQMREYYATSRKYKDRLKTHSAVVFKGFIATCRHHLPAGACVLDLGCGTKESSRLLNETGFQVVGADISPLFLSDPDIPPTPGRQFAASDAMAMPFGDGVFDAVVSFDAIEHIPDAEKALEEIDRILRPGGTAVLFSPNHFSPLNRLLDWLRMLRSSEARRPVFAETRRQAFQQFIENIKITRRKLRSSHPEFLYRTPDLTETEVVGADSDAVYLCHPVDLWRFFENRGYRLVDRAVPLSPTKAGRLVKSLISRWAPQYYLSTHVVARKGTERPL